MCVFIHTLIYSNIFEAISMNYCVYSNTEELLSFDVHVMCVCVYIYMCVQNLT